MYIYILLLYTYMKGNICIYFSLIYKKKYMCIYTYVCIYKYMCICMYVFYVYSTYISHILYMYEMKYFSRCNAGILYIFNIFRIC